MHDYEQVNKEIEEFINMKDKKPLVFNQESKTISSDKKELITLLTELLDLYKDIQLMLETKDFEGVKDKIISGDVKNALVCESLMKILKDECAEKAEIKNLCQNERSKIKKHEEEKQTLYLKINKLESDLDFTKRSNSELSRVIKDQKNLLIASKEKLELEQKSCESLKNVNKELEILRNKAYDRVQTFEKELNILKEKLLEKDKNLKNQQVQLKETDKEKECLNKKILNLEKTNESLKKKIDIKEKALEICNAELAKMINKAKKEEEMIEEIREKSSYYERLYKATNKQNEYLNAQLARMINYENVEKLDKNDFTNSDLSLVTTQSKEQAYKKRCKKYKKKYRMEKINKEKRQEEIDEIKKNIEKLKIENKKLQKERETAIAGNNEISTTLMQKVESLLAQNMKYQNMLIDNKDKKFDATITKINNNEKEQTLNEEERHFNESFRTVKEDNDSLLNFKLQNNNNLTVPKNKEIMYNEVFGDAGETKVRGENDSTLFLDTGNLRRPFKLANEYDEIPEVTIKNKMFNNTPKLSIPNRFFAAPKKDEIFTDDIKRIPKNNYQKKEEDKKSADSSKSVKTTSSLKDMLIKTENLQNKFENLEKQLEEINESELPPTKKIQDQIRAYTDYYYSDYLDFSNENDIL